MFSMTSYGYLTCRRRTRGRTQGWSKGTVSGTMTYPAGHGSHILLLPGDVSATSHPPWIDSQGEVRPPGADMEKRDKQGSTVLLMGLMKLRPLLHALMQCWVSQGERMQQSSILGSQAPAWA